MLKNKNLSRHVANAPTSASFEHDTVRNHTQPLTSRVSASLRVRTVPTLNPDGIKITVDDKTGGKGVLRVGCKEQGKQGLAAAVIGGKITQADIAADNGLIHVIDAVLIPIPPPPDNNGFAPDSAMNKG